MKCIVGRFAVRKLGNINNDAQADERVSSAFFTHSVSKKLNRCCLFIMSELYLVRHGQASFDSDNYDQLSPMGHQQAEILSNHWRSLDYQFDCIYCGSLRRQIETAVGLKKCVIDQNLNMLEGLNEFVSAPILSAYQQQFAVDDGFASDGNMKDKTFFQRFLEAACTRWINEQLDHTDIEPFIVFKQRVVKAITQIMTDNTQGKKVIVSTSGGVIAMAVQSILGLSDQQAIKLNWSVYNTSITRLSYSGKRQSLSVFNALPHLEQAGFTEKITFR